MADLDPVFQINYGVSGLGKTTDALYAFPDNAIYIGERNALRAPARSVVGLDLPLDQIVIPNRIGDVTDLITRDHLSLKKRGIIAAVVDDFSLVCLNTFTHYAASGMKGYGVQNAVVDDLHRFRIACRRAAIHVVVNAHEGAKHASGETGRMVLGGPKIRGQIQEDIGQAFDVVLRAVRSPFRPVGHKAEFQCGNDPDYVTKDRNNIVDGAAPLNTAEVLRAAGYRLPRAKGLEWGEEVVEQIALHLLDCVRSGFALNNRDFVRARGAEYRAMLASKTDNGRHVEWVLRDAYDRAVIRHDLASRRQLGF